MSEPGDVAVCLRRGRGERTGAEWMRDNAGEKWGQWLPRGMADAEMVRRKGGPRELAPNDAAMPVERHTLPLPGAPGHGPLTLGHARGLSNKVTAAPRGRDVSHSLFLLNVVRLRRGSICLRTPS